MKTGRFVLLLVLAALAGPLGAEETVREFKGSRGMETGDFEVRAPWILDWQVTGDYPQTMAVDVSLVDARTGAFHGSVLKTRWPGVGVRLFEESGTFRFNVISNLAGWTLKVRQLTKAEAEQYTPRVRGN